MFWMCPDPLCVGNWGEQLVSIDSVGGDESYFSRLTFLSRRLIVLMYTSIVADAASENPISEPSRVAE